MPSKIYRAIGLMSGTSMDGNDAALLETDGYHSIKVIDYIERPHEENLKALLKACDGKQDRTTSEMRAAEQVFSDSQIPLINELLERNALSASDIDVIGFHGQTTFHQPAEKTSVQLGDGQILATKTGIKTIYNFRQADMDAGGQGAPLIPIYHQALLKSKSMNLPIAIVNIGGVSNLTWIDGTASLIGFDTGPGNALIDDWVSAHTDQAFDDGGKIAAEGRVNDAIVEQFLTHPYLKKNYPKSLDRNAFADLSVNDLNLEDGAATLMEITARSISIGIHACPKKPSAIYIAGGGRYNTALLNRLHSITNLPVHDINKTGLNGDSIEAEGFAYMAVRTLLNEPISFPQTTGCRAPTVGGTIVQPEKVKAA